MAQFVVRNLEDDVRDKLRERAKQSGQSVEETVREILRAAVAEKREEKSKGVGTEIVEMFSGRGVTLDGPIPELRGQFVKPVDFGE